MKQLLFLLVLVLASTGYAQSAAKTQMTKGPIYDLSKTREDMKQLCTTCIRVSTKDTLILYGKFLGLTGGWTIVFDSTGRHRESNWYYDVYYDRTALKTIAARLTTVYGKPVMEEGPVLKASWHRGDTVILLAHVRSTDEISVHWRYKSDMPLTSIVSFFGSDTTDVRTGPKAMSGHPVFDLSVTRQDLVSMCTTCVSFAKDTVILNSRFAGMKGKWTLIFDKEDRHQETDWAIDVMDDTTGRYETIMTELKFLYGKPKMEDGPVIKATWRRKGMAIFLTKLEGVGEVGIHWRYTSELPLKRITPLYDKNTRIDVTTGFVMPSEEPSLQQR